jgi:cytochrome c oxidase cbb3-type subunit II
MNNGFILFLGIAVAMATSWFGLIFGSQAQLGNLQQAESMDTGALYPVARAGVAQQGLAVYRENGCYYCHSQSVRPAGIGNDLGRGWGERRSVARDYLLDQPVMVGFSRMGPDLKNVGQRLGNYEWQMLHLYAPKMMVPGSTMPPYPYLFEKRRIAGEPSRDALRLPKDLAPEPGYEIVPKPEAKALVHYLLSLRADTRLFEAPMQPKEEPPSEPAGQPESAPPQAQPEA